MKVQLLALYAAIIVIRMSPDFVTRQVDTLSLRCGLSR
jgi:hypothetical protein